MSILAKPMALSLPWVLLLVDWMRGRFFSRAMIIDKIPFFGDRAPGLGTYAQNTREIAVNFPDGFLVWFWSAAFYIEEFFWLGTLSTVYAMPEPVTLANPAYWVSFAVLACALDKDFYEARINRGFVLYKRGNKKVARIS
jgi:hypothetical protein